MTYTEIKVIKGRKYIYKRTSYRVDGKVKHTSKYIRPVEPVRKRKKGQGRKPTVFVKKLADYEKKELNKANRSKESFRKERAKIITLSSEGKTVNEICDALSKDRKTVVRAIRAFNIVGIKALERKKAKGRPPKFTKEQRAKILETIFTEPVKLGLHFTTWSLPRLKNYLISTGIVKHICIESIRNILKTEKTSYKKSRKRQYSNDPNFSKKNLPQIT